MNTVQAFWQFLYNVQHMTGMCEAVTQSTHSVPLTQNPVVYGGSCSQALQIALASHGAIAWVIGVFQF